MPNSTTDPTPAQTLMESAANQTVTQTANQAASQAANHATDQAANQAAQLSIEQSIQQMRDAFTYVEPQWFTLRWALVLLIVTMLLSWGMGRLMKLAGLQRARKWLALGRVLLWMFMIINLIFALSSVVSAHYWLPVGVVGLAMLGLAGLPWLRNITAGLAVAFEAQFEVGDPVKHGGATGEITHFGARAVTLRASDGTLHQVPNQNFAQDSVTRIESEGDAACEIRVRIPRGVSPERAMHLAQQAAFLTPLASPRHRPEVFLEMGERGPDGIEMRIRGWAFDPACREAFQSDVVARIHDLMRSEKSLPNGATF